MVLKPFEATQDWESIQSLAMLLNVIVDEAYGPTRQPLAPTGPQDLSDFATMPAGTDYHDVQRILLENNGVKSRNDCVNLRAVSFLIALESRHCYVSLGINAAADKDLPCRAHQNP